MILIEQGRVEQCNVVVVVDVLQFQLQKQFSLNFSGSRSRSLADIVVATPGRLVDHINKTANFSLQHLRFLVSTEYIT